MSLSRTLGRFATNPARWVDALILFVPIAILLEILHAEPTFIFVTAALGIVPLAGILGQATDALATHAGARLGALLNATFGNAAELIITIAAIRAGLVEVVKASITGSIIGNILLVLGLSLLAGGLKNGLQTFGRRTASMNVTTMAIAVVGLVIPAVFSHAIEVRNSADVENLSIGVAIALILVYVLSLVFTFAAREPGAPAAVKTEPNHQQHQSELPEDAGWSLKRALAVLGVGVVFIATLSEILVGAIEPVIAQWGLTELFVGVIVVPIIGNAAEHLVAVEMAIKNKMEITLGVALGSSMQIALLVSPLLVFISLLAGNPMSLVFNTFELAAIGVSVVIAALIALDGESNWLEGAQLLVVYVILGLAFFYLPS